MKDTTLAGIQDELEEVVEYGRKNLSPDKDSYHRIWYKLHTASDSTKWPNVLLLCELLFSITFSNSHVERMFSSLKVVKTNRRTNLANSTLNNLLEIHVEGLIMSKFSADQAVELWWKDCSTTSRVNQQPRQLYRLGLSSEENDSSDSDEEEIATVAEWDRWFGLEEPDDAVDI